MTYESKINGRVVVILTVDHGTGMAKFETFDDTGNVTSTAIMGAGDGRVSEFIHRDAEPVR